MVICSLRSKHDYFSNLNNEAHLAQSVERPAFTKEAGHVPIRQPGGHGFESHSGRHFLGYFFLISFILLIALTF
jgi:hypothetical protein